MESLVDLESLGKIASTFSSEVVAVKPTPHGRNYSRIGQVVIISNRIRNIDGADGVQ